MRTKKSNRGLFLITTLVLLVFLVIFSAIAVKLAELNLYHSRGAQEVYLARKAAESGIEYARSRIALACNTNKVGWQGAFKDGSGATTKLGDSLEITEYYMNTTASGEDMGWVEGRLRGNPDAMFFIYFTPPAGTFYREGVGNITPKYRSVNNMFTFDTPAENNLVSGSLYRSVPPLCANIIVQGRSGRAEKHAEILLVRLPNDEYNFLMNSRDGISVDLWNINPKWLLRSAFNVPPKVEVGANGGTKADVIVEPKQWEKDPFVDMRMSGIVKASGETEFRNSPHKPEDFNFRKNQATNARFPGEITKNKMKAQVAGYEKDDSATMTKLASSEVTVFSGNYVFRVETLESIMSGEEEDVAKKKDLSKKERDKITSAIAAQNKIISDCNSIISKATSEINAAKNSIADINKLISDINAGLATGDLADLNAQLSALNKKINDELKKINDAEKKRASAEAEKSKQEGFLSNTNKHDSNLDSHLKAFKNYDILKNNKFVLKLYYSDNKGDPIVEDGIIWTDGKMLINNNATVKEQPLKEMEKVYNQLKSAMTIDFNGQTGEIVTMDFIKNVNVGIRSGKESTFKDFKIIVDDATTIVPTFVLGAYDDGDVKRNVYINNDLGGVTLDGQLGGSGGILAGTIKYDSGKKTYVPVVSGDIVVSGRNIYSATGELILFSSNDVTTNPKSVYNYLLAKSSSNYDPYTDMYTTSRTISSKSTLDKTGVSTGNKGVDEYGLPDAFIAIAIINRAYQEKFTLPYSVRCDDDYLKKIGEMNIKADSLSGGESFTGKLKDLLEKKYGYKDSIIRDHIKRVLEEHSVPGYYGRRTITKSHWDALIATSMPNPADAKTVDIPSHNFQGLILCLGNFNATMQDNTLVLQGSLFTGKANLQCGNFNSIYDPSNLKILYDYGLNTFHQAYYSFIE